jgi:hypothetical protein
MKSPPLGRSSVGRTLDWQLRGHPLDPRPLHQPPFPCFPWRFSVLLILISQPEPLKLSHF